MVVKKIINKYEALKYMGFDGIEDIVEKEFPTEALYLRNMTADQFSHYSEAEQEMILQLYDAFYRVGKELVSDEKYDTFENYHKKTFVKDDMTILFEPSIDAWQKETHRMRMGSLGKCTTVEAIEKWNSNEAFSNIERIISDKLDGISLELNYDSGKLVSAVTRGDGFEGDDILENAKYFGGVVKQLTECWTCSIRGELIITKTNFEILNSIQAQAGERTYKNCRNAVSGLATKFKDRRLDILELIDFIAYDIDIQSVDD